MRHPALLDRGATVLVLIDLQEGYRRALHGWERVVAASRSVKVAAPQQLMLIFSITWRPGGKRPATSGAVWPRPRGYCSVTTRGTPRIADPSTRSWHATTTRCHACSAVR